MTKRALSATMLYMSTVSLMSAGVSAQPEKIQGNELFTMTVKPEPHDATDTKSVKAASEKFNADFDEALDAGWHETIADAMEAETAEPDVDDVDTAEQMQAAIDENDALKENVVTLTTENEAMSASLKAALGNNEEGQAALEAMTKERDAFGEKAEMLDDEVKKLQADLDAATAPKAE